MKYMGSKRSMLKNGLGEMIVDKCKTSNNFLDPFCGSGAVVWFATENITNKIIAGDLQHYAVDLANCVLLRTKAKINTKLLHNWVAEAKNLFSDSSKLTTYNGDIDFVFKNRDFCNRKKDAGTITKAYGGYYFSYSQALAFDLLRNKIPQIEPYYSIAKSALIIAATFCVASPGHTAQPFQPTSSAIKYILEAWNKDPFIYVEKALTEILTYYCSVKSKAYVGDAFKLIDKAKEGDLVFIDPPYSGVHYSRFYHVLETISRGYCLSNTGNGRYPSIEERPKSNYSMRSTSSSAMDILLKKISDKKASAIITFPAGNCSNGLSGDIIKEISKQYFKVKKDIIKGTFSTLGGNKTNRPARTASEELVLLLEPK